MKILKIETSGIYDNRDAWIMLEKLLDVAKEAGYTHVQEDWDGELMTIDQAIEKWSIL